MSSSSLQVFRRFFRRHPQTGQVDASGVISEECYEAWLESRTSRISASPEKAFHRAISAHLTGVDGRSPFTPAEEEALLRVVRRKERWPCFRNSKVKRGEMGFRAQGLHERTQQEDLLLAQQQPQHPHQRPTPSSLPASSSSPKRARAASSSAPASSSSSSPTLDNVHTWGKQQQQHLAKAAAAPSTPQSLLLRIEPNFPNQAVLVFDFAAQDFAHSLVLHNHQAAAAGLLGGGGAQLFKREEAGLLWTALRNAAAAAGEFYAARLSLWSAARQRHGPFNVFVLCEQGGLWALVAHEVEEEEEEAYSSSAASAAEEEDDGSSYSSEAEDEEATVA